MRDAGGRKYTFVDKDDKEIDINRVPEEITIPFINGYANQTHGQLLQTIVGHRAITGNGYLLVTETTLFGANKGIAEAFIPLNPADVKPVLTRSGLFIEYYEIELNSLKHKIPPDEIIQFSQNTMYNPFVGIGNVEKARLMYETSLRKDKYANEYFKKGARPSMVITDGSDRTAKDIERISKQFGDKYGGEDNAGKVMYLSGKGLDAKALTVSNKDMQFLEEKQYTRQTTLSLFGVPPVVAGIPDGANRAIADMQKLQYLANTINPIIQNLEDAINIQFVHKINPAISVRYAKHNTGDIDSVVKKLQAGIITPNMASLELGETVDDDNEERNVYYQPANFMPMGFVAETPDPTKKTEEGKLLSTPKAEDLNDPHNYDIICKALDAGNNNIKKFQLKYLRAGLKARVKTEDSYVSTLESYLSAQAKRVNQAFIDNKEKITQLITNQDEIQKKGFFDDLLTIVFDSKVEDSMLIEEIRPLHTSSVSKAINNVNGLAGAAVNPNLSNPVIANMLDRLGKGIVSTTTVAGVTYSVNETAKKEIARVTTKGIQAGQTIEELQDAISNSLGSKAEFRARRLARTESRIAYDSASKYAYTTLGVKTVDVVGCTQFEPDSDCGKKNIPIDTPLEFHPNHIGVVVPSEEP